MVIWTTRQLDASVAAQLEVARTRASPPETTGTRSTRHTRMLGSADAMALARNDSLRRAQAGHLVWPHHDHLANRGCTSATGSARRAVVRVAGLR